MTRPARRRSATTLDPAQLPASVKAALVLLLDAHACADLCQHPLWDFALSFRELQQETGLTRSQLRLLIRTGQVLPREETTRPEHPSRTFRRGARTDFTEKTAVVLTEAGLALAQQVASLAAVASALPPTPPRPCWDSARRELRVGETVVKRYRVPAECQEIILAAFEEEGWPDRIDDPLPVDPEQLPKARLHNVIAKLNRDQKHPLIRFHGDGHGQGITWHLHLPSENSPSSADGHPHTNKSNASENRPADGGTSPLLFLRDYSRLTQGTVGPPGWEKS